MPGHFIRPYLPLAWRGIDLTKIESRPFEDCTWRVFLHIDCDYTKEKLAQFALEELTAVGIDIKSWVLTKYMKFKGNLMTKSNNGRLLS